MDAFQHNVPLDHALNVDFHNITINLPIMPQRFLLLGHGEEHLRGQTALAMKISPKNTNNRSAPILRIKVGYRTKNEAVQRKCPLHRRPLR
eukprot:Gb_27496 [translate_table: standard]